MVRPCLAAHLRGNCCETLPPSSSRKVVCHTVVHQPHLGERLLQTSANARPAPLAVYGGPGVEHVVDAFNTACRLDQGYRTAHHSERLMPSTTWGMVAYPVELDGAPTPAQGSHRARGRQWRAPDSGHRGRSRPADYHITPEQAAAIANDAGVKLLAYYHLRPSPDGALPRRLFAQGVNEARHGDWTIADKGSLYTLPLGSNGLQIGRVGE
jgi:ribonuclease BN (tRNA processing enzyme)